MVGDKLCHGGRGEEGVNTKYDRKQNTLGPLHITKQQIHHRDTYLEQPQTEKIETEMRESRLDTNHEGTSIRSLDLSSLHLLLSYYHSIPTSFFYSPFAFLQSSFAFPPLFSPLLSPPISLPRVSVQI